MRDPELPVLLFLLILLIPFHCFVDGAVDESGGAFFHTGGVFLNNGAVFGGHANLYFYEFTVVTGLSNAIRTYFARKLQNDKNMLTS